VYCTVCCTAYILTRKLCYRKDDRAMRFIYEFWLGFVNPNLGEEEVVGGRRWNRLKERW